MRSVIGMAATCAAMKDRSSFCRFWALQSSAAPEEVFRIAFLRSAGRDAPDAATSAGGRPAELPVAHEPACPETGHDYVDLRRTDAVESVDVRAGSRASVKISFKKARRQSWRSPARNRSPTLCRPAPPAEGQVNCIRLN